MYLDLQNILIPSTQDLTQDAATYESTNVIDLGATPRPIGNGETVKVWGQILTTFDSAGDGVTVNFQLVDSSAATLDADLTVHDQTGALAQATLVQGYQFILYAKLGAIAQRYLGINVVIGVEASTAGSAIAGIVLDTQTALTGWPANDGF